MWRHRVCVKQELCFCRFQEIDRRASELQESFMKRRFSKKSHLYCLCKDTPDTIIYLMNNHSRFDLSTYNIMFEKPQRAKDPLFNIKLVPFYFFITQIIKPGIIVELGVHSGNTLAAFCQALKFLGLTAQCFGVDTWEGDIHTGSYDESVYTELLSYIEKDYTDSARLLRMTFDNALEHFSDRSIDLLHIDGTHTYEAVSHDFKSWLPKMSSKGVVMLHDTKQKIKNYGVWKLWEEVSGCYPSWEIDFESGLGILAVGKEVNEECITFLSEARKNSFYREFFLIIGERLELENNARILEGIHQSRGWRALSLYYRIKGFFMGTHP